MGEQVDLFLGDRAPFTATERLALGGDNLGRARELSHRTLRCPGEARGQAAPFENPTDRRQQDA
jgi:hypothetical protein